MRLKQFRPSLVKTYSEKHICAHYVWNKENKLMIYILRQGFPGGRSNEGYTCFNSHVRDKIADIPIYIYIACKKILQKNEN